MCFSASRPLAKSKGGGYPDGTMYASQGGGVFRVGGWYEKHGSTEDCSLPSVTDPPCLEP